MQFKIKEIREEKGYSQEKLSELSGVSRNLIARLETGELTSTSTNTLFKLAQALNVKVKSLFLQSKFKILNK